MATTNLRIYIIIITDHFSSHFPGKPDLPDSSQFSLSTCSKCKNTFGTGQNFSHTISATGWNSLPCYDTFVPTLAVFQKCLKTYLYTIRLPPNCQLCITFAKPSISCLPYFLYQPYITHLLTRRISIYLYKSALTD